MASVQALHWFYDRTHQHVVASWMTKLYRERAIADNLRYIDRVVADLLDHHATNGCTVYEGFSQGASMAYRAASAIRHQSDGLIVLGGDIPPELRQADSLDLPPTLIGRGVRDEWFTQKRYDADLSFLASSGVTVEPVVFDGGHEWTDEFRLAAGKLLASHIQPG